MSDEQGWNARYAESDRIWSGRPNVELVKHVAGLTPGRALDLGCGEGADAVWLAGQGWTVTAVDLSTVALERAAGHAADAGVADRIDFQHHDLAVSFPAGEFDLISVQFLHSRGPFDREGILRTAAGAVAKGGVLLIEGHLDFGPFSAHDHGDVRFPTPDEVIADLTLASGEWEVLVAEAHDRSQIGPDGAPATRTDSTVLLRRVGRLVR